MNNKLPQDLPNDILIVDDEPLFLDFCRICVNDMGIFRNIVTAKDGQEAIVKLTNQEFRLCILDVNLPKKDVFAILSRFKEIAPRTIIISGGLGTIALKKALHIGVKHFLVKPFNEESLINKVNILLGRKDDEER